MSKSSAVSFVACLAATGGNSASCIALAGLVGSANLEAGKNKPMPPEDKLAHAGQVDTSCLLSDGRPSTGKYIECSGILREVRRENEFGKFVIHTLGIGDFEKALMNRLALESGGILVDLGK